MPTVISPFYPALIHSENSFVHILALKLQTYEKVFTLTSDKI